MITYLDNQLPAGNIRVIAIDGNHAQLCNEPRGTIGEHWFYWKFRCGFDAPGHYVFQFMDGPSIGPRGACVSTDNGKSWHWNGIENTDIDTESFTFNCEKPQEVQFCVSIPHMQTDLDEFIASLPPGAMDLTTICHSRHGRAVEMLRFGSPEAPHKIILTSRHHCQEAMATYAMQGLLREIADHPDLFKDYCVYAVPFADKDGALEGDQGKRRQPHDHARDYGDHFIYPETGAIMKLVQETRADFILDMHCPWLRSSCNEYTYFVGKENPFQQQMTDRFSQILEKEAPADFPFFMKDNVLFGTSWNTSANYKEGFTLPHWAATLPWSPVSLSMEIPFANCRDVTLTIPSALHLGQAIARSIHTFLSLENSAN